MRWFLCSMTNTLAIAGRMPGWMVETAPPTADSLSGRIITASSRSNATIVLLRDCRNPEQGYARSATEVLKIMVSTPSKLISVCWSDAVAARQVSLPFALFEATRFE